MVEQQTVQTSTPPAKQDHLGRVLFTLAVIALALAPTQLRMVVKGIPLSPVEPILALAILVWAVRWFFIRDTRSLPPLTHWVIVLSVALGIFALHDSLVQAAQGAPPEDPIWKVNFINEFAKPFIKKELAQVILYLIVAATVFRAAFTTPQRIRIAAIALLATTTLAIGLGVVQRVQLARQYEPDPSKRLVFANHYDRMDEEVKKQLSKKEKDRLERVMGVWDGQNFTPCSSAKAYLTAQKPEAVCSTFAAWAEHGYYPSRTAYAGFLALVLPFALVLMATSRRRPGIIAWMGVLLVGAAVSVLAG